MPCALMRSMASSIWTMTVGWMPSVGSSIRRSLGRARSTRRDRELLLLPARQHPALAPEQRP